MPAHRDTPRQAHLGNEHAIRADLTPVSDGDQIAELRAGADPRGSQRGPVDGAVGPDLHVVFQDDLARLRDLHPLLAYGSVSQSVLADDGTGVNGHAVPQLAAIVDGNAGIERHVVAQPGMRSDEHAGIEGHVITDDHVVGYGRSGSDIGAFPEAGGVGNMRPLVQTPLRMLAVTVNLHHRHGERLIGIITYQLRHRRIQRGVILHDDRRGMRRAHPVTVLGVGQEGDLSLLGGLDGVAPVNHPPAVSAEFVGQAVPRQVIRQLGQRQGAHSQPRRKAPSQARHLRPAGQIMSTTRPRPVPRAPRVDRLWQQNPHLVWSQRHFTTPDRLTGETIRQVRL